MVHINVYNMCKCIKCVENVYSLRNGKLNIHVYLKLQNLVKNEVFCDKLHGSMMMGFSYQKKSRFQINFIYNFQLLHLLFFIFT